MIQKNCIIQKMINNKIYNLYCKNQRIYKKSANNKKRALQKKLTDLKLRKCLELNCKIKTVYFFIIQTQMLQEKVKKQYI